MLTSDGWPVVHGWLYPDEAGSGLRGFWLWVFCPYCHTFHRHRPQLIAAMATRGVRYASVCTRHRAARRYYHAVVSPAAAEAWTCFMDRRSRLTPDAKRQARQFDPAYDLPASQRREYRGPDADPVLYTFLQPCWTPDNPEWRWQAAVPCPHCGLLMWHGADPCHGTDLGHRAAHCPNWRSYRLAIATEDVVAAKAAMATLTTPRGDRPRVVR